MKFYLLVLYIGTPVVVRFIYLEREQNIAATTQTCSCSGTLGYNNVLLCILNTLIMCCMYYYVKGKKLKKCCIRNIYTISCVCRH